MESNPIKKAVEAIVEYMKKHNLRIFQVLDDGSTSSLRNYTREEMLEMAQEAKREESQKRSVGFVYLLYSPDTNLYKIGRARKLSSRYSTIAKQSPVEVRMIYSFKSNDAKYAERILHKKFRDQRVQGEWFSLLEKDVDFIRAIRDGQL